MKNILKFQEPTTLPYSASSLGMFKVARFPGPTHGRVSQEHLHNSAYAFMGRQQVVCGLNRLLKSDLHALLIATKGHMNPISMNTNKKNNVLKMHGPENAHFVCSDEFQAFRYDLLPTSVFSLGFFFL